MGPLVYANHEHPVGDGNGLGTQTLTLTRSRSFCITAATLPSSTGVGTFGSFRVVGTSILVGVPNVTDAVALFSRKSSKVL